MKIIDTADLTPTSLTSQMEKDWVYNGLDCCLTLEIFNEISPQLDNASSQAYELSRSFQAPVLEMGLRGIRIDAVTRAESIAAYEADILRLEKQLNRILYEVFDLIINWRSNAALMNLFYTVMKIPPVRKRNTKGEYSPTVNRDALEKLQSYFFAKPIISHLLAMRDIGKKISTLKTSVDSDGRARTSYNIAGTTTFRFSSSMNEFGTGGNFQNIENQLRRPFVADPGMKLAYIDLEQAESRAVGAICWNLFHDGGYLDACESGDLHTSVCRMGWTNLPWTGDLRVDKSIAEQPFYRQHSYRHMAKVLGHGCLTEDHEVLTPEGWVSISDKPEIIMTWNETQSKFESVSAWTDFQYTGTLNSFEGNSISLNMTDDHRVPYRTSSDAPLKEKLASQGPGTHMPLGFGFIGGTENPPARLIAAIMSDGHIISKKSTVFHLHKQRKIKRLKYLCELYNVEFKKNENSKYRVGFSCEKKAGPYMFNWSTEALDAFLDEYKYWDGHIANTSVSLFSADKEHLNWIKTLGRLRGIGGNINVSVSGFGQNPAYSLQQNNRRWTAGKSVEHDKINVSDIRVLCPTVPSSWFYVRHKEKICVTGNSNYNGKPPTMAQHTKLETSLIKDFQTRYFTAFPAIPKWHQWVSQQLQSEGHLYTLTGHRRWFFGRRNDDTTLREAIAYGPQGTVGVLLNRGMLNVWRLNISQLLLQIHDAIVVQFPEKQEDVIVPQLVQALRVPIELAHGRTLIIPSEAKTGWNWADASPENPDGLTKFKGHDTRTRSPIRTALDRRF